MDPVKFCPVATPAQEAIAAELIAENLTWLLTQAKKNYQIEFDVEAMVAADTAADSRFIAPDGSFYLVEVDGEAAGVGCLKNLGNGVAEIQRM